MLPERFPRDYGGYRLTSLLGSGGSADVYRAEIPVPAGQPRHEVAIRRVARGIGGDEHVLAVLFEESRIWVTMRHSNIVSVVDIGQHEGDCFLVLELVDGLAASQLVLANGPLPMQEGFLIAADIADALEYGHTHAIAGRQVVVIHRDVKPPNVLISIGGEVKLTDFGIARTNDRLGRTAAGVVRGSLHYLSPEQVRKEPLTARTDLFALGCTLHNLLTGRPLLDLPKDSIFRMLHRGDVPPPDERLPLEAKQVISALTAANPLKRPESAQEVSFHLRHLIGSTIDVRESLAARVRATCAELSRDSGPAGTATTTRESPVGTIGMTKTRDQSPRRRR